MMIKMKTLTINGKTYEIVDGSAIAAPATAAVGQTIVVKSVDENGKPIEWEAVDVVSGTGNASEQINAHNTSKTAHNDIRQSVSTLSSLVGNRAVSAQIDSAIANKSDSGHKHDSDYDTKGAADTALASAKTYADSAASKVKNDLLNGAGGAYDTLKELGDLIDDNQDAIEALETVAASKASAADLTAHTDNKTNPHGVTATQINAVPTSRTVNGKALSANITLSASDVGADASGSANTALTNAKSYTDSEISKWVGTTPVPDQIDNAIAEVIPDVSIADNGKFLRVVNGVWAAASIPNAEEAEF